MSRRWRVLAAFVAAATVVSGLAAMGVTPAGAWAALLAGVSALRDAGPAGVAAFVCIYLGASLAMVPAAWLIGVAAVMYGLGPGMLLGWTLSTGAAAIAWRMAQGRLRGPVRRRIAGRPRFTALDRAAGEQGLQLVVLTRLSPLAPYNVVSYALGLTAVPGRTYLAGTALGGVVPVVVHAIVGASVGDLAGLGDGAGGPAWLQGAVIATTLLASLGIARFVQKALAAPAPTQPGPIP